LRDADSQLPAITISSEKELAAALGLGDLADASGEVRAGQNFILDFDQVHLQKVSLVQLRVALKKSMQECEAVRPFIDASYSPPAPTRAKGKTLVADAMATIVATRPPPLLIGMVFTARRVVHISNSEAIGGDAQLSFTQNLMKRLHITSGFKVSGGGKVNSSQIVDLVSEKLVPVAFAPAFVVTATRQFGQGQTSYELASVDPDSLQSEIQYARLQENRSIALVQEAFKQNSAQFIMMQLTNQGAPTMVLAHQRPDVAAFSPTSRQDAVKSVFRLDGGA
jgi:hypothetical protein